MNNSVVAEQLAQRKGDLGASSPTKDGKETKKKWPFCRKASGMGKETVVSSAVNEEEEMEGMHVDFYLVVNQT